MIPKTIDLIVPLWFVDKEFFLDNLKSWVRELPLRKVWFGMDNPSLDFKQFEEGVKTIIPDTIQYELIDQTKIKTLGKCLAELMKLVETEWFVYIHSDVTLTENCWELMKSFAKPKIGIVESTHMHQQKEGIKDLGYYFRERSYSGFQLFQKKSVMDLVNRIEDDYMYRNEDYIFRNACENAGFEYKKSWTIHYHQNFKTTWSIETSVAMDMQWKGFIKYSTPDKLCLDACTAAIDYCVTNFKYDMTSDMEFIRTMSSEWRDFIMFYYLNKVISVVNQAIKK